jgi:hypothetical protein
MEIAMRHTDLSQAREILVRRTGVGLGGVVVPIGAPEMPIEKKFVPQRRRRAVLYHLDRYHLDRTEALLTNRLGLAIAHGAMA